jgi:hypothetical protein
MKILPDSVVVLVAILALSIGVDALFNPKSKGDKRLRICFSITAFLSQMPRLLRNHLNHLQIGNHHIHLFPQLELLLLGMVLGIGILGIILGGWKYKLMEAPKND